MITNKLRYFTALFLSIQCTCIIGSAGAASTSAEDKLTICVKALKNQPVKRFLTGDVFYLPSAAGRGCLDAEWVLTSAPALNQAAVIKGTDGYDKFIPLTAGDYEFRSMTLGDVKKITVLDYRDMPFENYNYYPTRSMAVVGDEIWVTSTFTGEVSRTAATNLEKLDSVSVGPWPVALATDDALPWVLVAHKAGDTIGFIEKSSKRLIDAVWVGDEPANIILGPKGELAFVALATDDQVAVIDIEERRVVKKIDVGIDPLAMTLDVAGMKLYVASKRSGRPSREPYGDDPIVEEKDITIIDLTTLKVENYIINIASTINDIQFNQRDGRLYVLNLRNNPRKSLVKPELKAFIHELSIIDVETRTKLKEIDISRQETSGGPAISLQRMILTKNLVWIVSEGQNQLIALDAETFEEVLRIDVTGRPRNIMLHDNRMFIHEHQDLALKELTLDGFAVKRVSIADDPRPAASALGQKTLTGAGIEYGAYFSCNNCHLDSTSDGLVWNTGPFAAAFVPRPHFWLEGTAPLGWTGYSDSVEAFGFEAHSIVGIIPTNEQVKGLTSYLSSMVPPPPANSLTERDGSLSEAAKKGKRLFSVNGCVFCHQMPLGTIKKTIDESITEGEADIPSLVGAYRYKSWLKHGEASTLREAVVAALEAFGWPLPTSDRNIDSLTRYVAEMTSRDFFLLDSTPDKNQLTASVTPVIKLTFSHLVYEAEENLARIRVFDWLGREQAVEKNVDRRTITLTLEEPLNYDTFYYVSIGRSFESFRETKIYGGSKLQWFKTISKPMFVLDGDYELQIDFPFFDVGNGEVDPTRTQPVMISISAEPLPSGANLTMQYRPELSKTEITVIDGDTLHLPSMPIPAGPISFADGFSFNQSELEDLDGDGVGDFSEGTMRLSGPGFKVDEVTWSLRKKQ